MSESLGEALPRMMAEVRDKLLPLYDGLGPAGAFGASMLRAELDRAAKAMAEGDVVAMLRAYDALKNAE